MQEFSDIHFFHSIPHFESSAEDILCNFLLKIHNMPENTMQLQCSRDPDEAAQFPVAGKPFEESPPVSPVCAV
mgnify:FL=1